MLQRHHIRGIRQTIFSSLVVLVISGGLFFVLRPNVFSKASNEVSNYKPDEAPVYKLPTDDIKNTTDSTSEESSLLKKTQNTYTVKPQGLPTFIATTVVDGNTIILDDKIRVRLVGIKAPGKDEDMGTEAADFLKKMIEKKEVYFQRDEKNPKDSFGRMLGIIYLDKKNVNIEMIRAGMVHIYPITPSIVGYSDWQAFEDEAREAKRGLWAGEKSTESEKTDKQAIPTL